MPIRKSKLESIQGYRPHGSTAETEETSGVKQAKVRQEKLNHIPGYSKSADLTIRAEERMRQREADSYTGSASGSAGKKSGQSTSLPRLPGGAASWYKKDSLLGAALDRAQNGTAFDGTQGPVKLTDPVRNALAAEQTRAQARVKELEEEPFAHKLWAADRESLLAAKYGSTQGYKDRLAGEQAKADAAGAAVKQIDAQHRQEHWAGLKERPDFAENSQYRSTRHGEAKMNWAGSYTDTGYGDILYDYVNGDENARRIQDNLDVGGSGSLYATTHGHYKDLPENTVQTFNYLYATRGKEAAYNYLDEAAAREYTGVEALGYGFAQGSGVTSAAALLGSGYGLLTGDEEAGARTRDWYGGFLEESAQAGQQHPYAYGAGNVSGNLALMAGLNAGLSTAEGALRTGVKIGGKTFALQMTPAVQTVVNSSAAFLAADAAHNAGAAATGYMNAADFLKSAGTAGVQGFAGGLAGGLVSSGMAQTLKESGLMTPFMEFVRQSASGFASAGANTAAGYLLREDKPSREQAAADFATAFLFSVLQGAVSAYSTTQANKARMEEAYGRIAEEYSRLSRGWGQMTPEARAEAAAQIRQRTQDFRTGLNRSYMAGQQDTVDAMNRALDGIDAAMGQYAGGFGSPAAGGLPPGSADLTAQVAQAVEQGLAVARGNGSSGGETAPAGPDPGLMGAAAAQGVGTAVLPGRDFAEDLQRQDELALRRWEEQTRAQALDQMVENLQNGRMPSGLPVEGRGEDMENAAREGGEGKYAIVTTGDGKRYVRADRQVIFGNDPDSWSEQLEDYINGKIRHGQDVTLIGDDGDELRLTATSAGKLSDNHTSDGRTMSDEAYERKVNAASHIDELVQVSRRRSGGRKEDEDGRHGDMASGGWNYRTAYFMDFDGKYYRATISVAQNADGGMVYNIGQMKEEAHPKIKGSRAKNDDGLRGFASSRINVTNIDKSVNRKLLPEPVEPGFPAERPGGRTNKTEGTNHGTEETGIHLRDGGERDDGAYPGRELRALAGGAGSDQSRYVPAGSADAGAASLAYGREVSTRYLGIGRGSRSDRIRMVIGGSTESVRAARALARERGLKLVLFGGDDLTIRRPNGKTVRASAYISGQYVFVRADHPDYTSDQLMRHEAGHDRIAKGEIDPRRVRQRIEQVYGWDGTAALAGQYESAYRESGLNAEEVWEEVICDSLGDMNIFHDIPRMEERAQRLLDETRIAADAELAANRTRGPPAEGTGLAEDKASRKYWRPKLSAREWELLNHRMNVEIRGNVHNLDSEMKWLYADEKGVRVFALYGVGDGTVPTPLYASGGNQATADYQVLPKFKEEYLYGADGYPETFNRWFKNARHKFGASNGNMSYVASGKSADGHDRISSVQGDGDGRGGDGHGAQAGGRGPGGVKPRTASIKGQTEAPLLSAEGTGLAEDKASRGGVYRKVGQQAWRQIQRERMLRYGAHFDTMPRMDAFYAHDMLFVIENFDESSFGVIEAIDPGKNQEKANIAWEVIKNGGIGDASAYRRRVENLRRKRRNDNGSSVSAGDAGTGRQDAGLHLGTGRYAGRTGHSGKTAGESGGADEIKPIGSTELLAGAASFQNRGQTEAPLLSAEGTDWAVDKTSRDPLERRRALRKGEMVNEFRNKVNWHAYHQELKKSKYDPDCYDDGEIATMYLDNVVLTLQMQRTGEWSVIKMEDTRNARPDAMDTE